MNSKVIASSSNWIESSAVEQLYKAAQLPGMHMVVGMPDLHPGKGAPIGAVFAAENIVYPHLVGNDIGCGMGLWQTELASDKPKLDQWVRCLDGLEGPWEGNTRKFLEEEGVEPGAHDMQLGTIGGGNHFVELQRLSKICDQDYADKSGVDSRSVFLLVHSGSRRLGEHVLHGHQQEHGDGGLAIDSPGCSAYLSAHDHAVTWARANRKLIALRFLQALGTYRCRSSGPGRGRVG